MNPKKKASPVDPTELAALRAALHTLPPEHDADRRGVAIARIAQDVSLPTVIEVLDSRTPALSHSLLRSLAIELAVRGKPIRPEHPALRALTRGDASEPPPWLTAIESGLPRRASSFGPVEGGARSVPGRPADRAPRDPLVVSAWHEITADADRDAIAAPVRSWTVGSNGRVEVRVFALEDAHGAHPDRTFLRELGLASVPAAHGVALAPTSAASALAELVAAGHGGTYGSFTPDAPARDAAWRSLRALVGAPAHSRWSDVERHALAAGFAWFDETPFFEGQFHQLGLAVVSPSRDRLALLAAVDTD